MSSDPTHPEHWRQARDFTAPAEDWPGFRAAAECAMDDLFELADDGWHDRERHKGEDVATLVRLLSRLADGRDALAVLYRGVEQAIVEALPDREWVDDDHHVQVRHARKSVRTDAVLLLGAVRAAATKGNVDPDTGEIAQPTVDAVVDTIADCYGLHNKSVSPRKTALKRLDIDLEEYQDHEGWRPPTLQWHRRPSRNGDGSDA